MNQNHFLKFFSKITLILPFFLLASTSLAASSVFVSPDGNNANSGSSDSPYATIQYAIDNVDDGGAVNIKPGTYAEQIIITKNVTLSGADKTTTIINSPSSLTTESDGSNRSIIEVKGAGTNVAISNLTIQSAAINQPDIVGLHIHGMANTSISNNIFQNIKSSDSLTNASSNIYEFQDVSLLVSDAGTSVSISNNAFSGITHAVVDRAAIYIEKSAAATISNNTISNFIYSGGITKRLSAGIVIWDAANDGIIISGNTIQNNNAGIIIGSATGIQISGNTISVSSGNYGAVPNRGIWVTARRSTNPCENGCVTSSTISGNSIVGGGSGYGIAVGSVGSELGANIAAPSSALITGNTVTNWNSGIYNARSNPDTNSIVAKNNSISGNLNYGIENSRTILIDAILNWWGNATGPGGVGNGSGNPASANVIFNPWYADSNFTNISGGHSITVSIARGSGNVSPSSQSVIPGGSASISIIPDASYRLGRIVDNGSVISLTGDTYTISNVTSDHTVSVYFLADEETYAIQNLNLDGNTTLAVFPGDFTGNSVISIPSNVSNGRLDFSAALSGSGPKTASVAGSISLNTVTPRGTVMINIPSGTIFSGPSSWNGIIKTGRFSLSTGALLPVSSGKVASTSMAFEIGLSGQTLTFDKGVRLLLPETAGLKIGYSGDLVNFTEITDTCAADTEAAGNALPSNGACKITSGNDTVIWTKHFTEFIAYEETDVSVPSAPIITPGAGSYNTPQTVSINSSQNATTFYTLDGTTPSNLKTQYSNPFTVNGANGASITVKAISYIGSSTTSTIASAIFSFDTVAPSRPIIASIATSTVNPTQTITGSKDANTSILLNNSVIVPLNSETSWEYLFTAASGANSLSFTSKDAAGNLSSSTTSTVTYTPSESGANANNNNNNGGGSVSSPAPNPTSGGGPISAPSSGNDLMSPPAANVADNSSDIGNETGEVLGASIFKFTSDLKKGTENNDVLELQKALTNVGAYSGPLTGYFGSFTETAVKKFQALHGISQTGYFGPLTRAALNKTTQQKNNSANVLSAADVAKIQAQIIILQNQLNIILEKLKQLLLGKTNQ